MDVEANLDDQGRGKMSGELWVFFVGAGCEPACHICGEDIEEDGRFRLKNYARENTSSLMASVMICAECDDENKKLPIPDAKLPVSSDSSFLPCARLVVAAMRRRMPPVIGLLHPQGDR